MRTRYHSIVTYLNRDEILRVLNTFSSRVRGAVFILHDRDVDESGSLVEPHYHIVLRTVAPHAVSVILSWFKRFQFSDQNGLKNSFGEPVFDLTASCDYLTHYNNPEKFQYETKDLFKFGDFGFYRTSYTNGDHSIEIVDKMLNDCYPLRNLVIEYGREYVYHYRAYKEIVEDIRLQNEYLRAFQ